MNLPVRTGEMQQEREQEQDQEQDQVKTLKHQHLKGKQWNDEPLKKTENVGL